MRNVISYDADCLLPNANSTTKKHFVDLAQCFLVVGQNIRQYPFLSGILENERLFSGDKKQELRSEI
ncbi:hypothetical protein [Pantoea vagans]|uniref:hypothetical protein n=1 Tax=Pantoea vagans TaxID=470934 RepID=UPI003FA35EFC